jgi:hypothetical protein
MVTCDACKDTIQKHEQHCITPDGQDAHPACFAKAIRTYLMWSNGRIVDFDLYRLQHPRKDPEE